MLCETCHTKEATVHIASVMYAAANVDARHFCEPCAQVAQTANPVLSVTARNLPPVSANAVTSIATPARTKIQGVEKKLAELDPIWEAFCARRREYRFVPGRELWPHRMAWAQGKINCRLTLAMDMKFTEVLARGFYPEMPWSLYATASLPFWTQSPGKTSPPQADPANSHKQLTFELLRRVPFSELAKVLEQALERGFSMLSQVSREDVWQKGEVPQGKHGPHRSYPW